MNEKSLNRKEFLKKFGAIGVTAVGVTGFLKACGGGGSDAPRATVDPCTDVSGLTETDLALRKNLQYIEVTEKPEERCDNCQLYKLPENGNGCGGCLLFAGPVTAAGWCASWVVKQG